MNTRALDWYFSLREKRSRGNEQFVLMDLCCAANEHDEVHASPEQLEQICKRKIRTIRKHMKGLVAKGFVRVLPQFNVDGGREANIYAIMIPPDYRQRRHCQCARCCEDPEHRMPCPVCGIGGHLSDAEIAEIEGGEQ